MSKSSPGRIFVTCEIYIVEEWGGKKRVLRKIASPPLELAFPFKPRYLAVKSAMLGARLTSTPHGLFIKQLLWMDRGCFPIFMTAVTSRILYLYRVVAEASQALDIFVFKLGKRSEVAASKTSAVGVQKTNGTAKKTS